MVDVTKENFGDILPTILKDITESSFVAVDTEFTGLLTDAAFEGNLFDDGSHRYHKISVNLRRVSICQLGLAIFKGVPNSNAYSATSYNFYLRPHSCFTQDESFMCQTSSIEFLIKYKFDFNKWLYGGVPYLNNEQKEKLHTDLTGLIKGEKEINLPYEVQDILSEMSVWSKSMEEGDQKPVHLRDISITTQVLLVSTINVRFLNLWAWIENEEVIVKKVSASERMLKMGEDETGEKLVNKVVEKMLGFSHIFHHLTSLKKPLVLHNCLLDLLLLYKQFYRNLPHSYEGFKMDLHNLFPAIYDTKFLAMQLKKDFKKKNEEVVSVLRKTGLKDLSTSLQQDLPVLYRPSFHHLPLDNKYNGVSTFYHEAGYDAYQTGFCFVNLAHLYAMGSLSTLSQHRPLSPREHIYSLKNLSNCIQLPRASVSHMVLGGSDPKSLCPPWLLIESSKTKQATPILVSAALAPYGAVDVVPRNRNSVLVATASWDTAKDILRSFALESNLKVTKYSPLRHSPVMRTLVWSGLIVSSGLSALLVFSSLKN